MLGGCLPHEGSTVYIMPGNQYRRRLLKVVMFGVAECLVIVVLILLVSAGRIRSMPVNASMEVGLGPVHLVHIEKNAVSGGYSLILRPYMTLGGLLVSCLVMETLIVWRFSSPPASDFPQNLDDT